MRYCTKIDQTWTCSDLTNVNFTMRASCASHVSWHWGYGTEKNLTSLCVQWRCRGNVPDPGSDLPLFQKTCVWFGLQNPDWAAQKLFVTSIPGDPIPYSVLFRQLHDRHTNLKHTNNYLKSFHFNYAYMCEFVQMPQEFKREYVISLELELQMVVFQDMNPWKQTPILHVLNT